MPVILARASQQAAGYRPEGGVERCAWCRFYGSANNCGRIIGPVSPRGWCRYFSRMVWLRMDGGDDYFGTAGPPGATLNLSFLDGILPTGITFTRASTASYFDSTGTMRTAAVNVPRFDYSPSTRVLNGLLIEQASTNLLLNSATLSTQSVTTTAQSYTLSFYGTGTITLSGAFAGSLVGTGAYPARATTTFTATAGTLTLTVTGTVQSAQLEALAFPTSYIPTTSAAVTRSVDVATMASIPGRHATAESFQGEFLLSTSQNPNCVIVGDNASTRDIFSITPAPLRHGSWDTVAAAVTTNSLTLGTVAKAATTWATPNAGSVCLNAGSVVSVTTQTSGFAAIATFRFMNDAGGAADQANGWIRRFRYWPRVLSNTEMQSVTT